MTPFKGVTIEGDMPTVAMDCMSRVSLLVQAGSYGANWNWPSIGNALIGFVQGGVKTNFAANIGLAMQIPSLTLNPTTALLTGATSAFYSEATYSPDYVQTDMMRVRCVGTTLKLTWTGPLLSASGRLYIGPFQPDRTTSLGASIAGFLVDRRVHQYSAHDLLNGIHFSLKPASVQAHNYHNPNSDLDCQTTYLCDVTGDLDGWENVMILGLGFPVGAGEILQVSLRKTVEFTPGPGSFFAGIATPPWKSRKPIHDAYAAHASLPANHPAARHPPEAMRPLNMFVNRKGKNTSSAFMTQGTNL